MKISYARFAAALVGAAFSASASAGYHVTAFGNTPGFEKIMAEDYKGANTLLAAPIYLQSKYARLANLCVAQLKSEEVEAALGSCNRALSTAPAELRSSLVSLNHKRAEVMTHLYSNRGVVRAIKGDVFGARSDFERAVALDGDNDNARRNLEYVANSELAQRSE